jgi:hypothetical protein
MPYCDVIVLHVRDVPHPDGLGQEYDVIYPETFNDEKDIPQEYETIEDWIENELRNSKKWKCLLSVEDGGLDYIEVYVKK